MFWPPDAGPELARAYRELIEAAPDEVGGALIYLTAPPEEFVPESMHEQLAAAILVTYTGPEAEAREAIAPLLALQPAGEMIAELPYAEPWVVHPLTLWEDPADEARAT